MRDRQDKDFTGPDFVHESVVKWADWGLPHVPPADRRIDRAVEARLADQAGYHISYGSDESPPCTRGLFLVFVNRCLELGVRLRQEPCGHAGRSGNRRSSRSNTWSAGMAVVSPRS